MTSETTRPRILVAEDDADMRAYVAHVLSSAWQVTAVGDGKQALIAAIADPPDLVLADVLMPSLDGFELLRRLRAEPSTRHIPIVMLSACDDEQSRVVGLEAGADDYVIKPFYPRELHARVRVNLELARARMAAGAARAESEAKDQFIAMLGHELRNPLAPIVTALELITMVKQPDARLLDVLQRQVHHLMRLVDDMLDVARIVRGKLDLRTSLVDLDLVIQRSVELAGPSLEARDQQLEQRLTADCVVNGDVDRLVQVVSNLLTNAAKFSPRGSRITLVTRQLDHLLHIEVRDHGQGIPPALLEQLFDPFVQAPQDLDRPRSGLGLGLAIARGIVELHRGRIAAYSDGPGQGSLFCVELPAVEEVSPRPAPAP